MCIVLDAVFFLVCTFRRRTCCWEWLCWWFYWFQHKNLPLWSFIHPTAPGHLSCFQGTYNAITGNVTVHIPTCYPTTCSLNFFRLYTCLCNGGPWSPASSTLLGKAPHLQCDCLNLFSTELSKLLIFAYLMGVMALVCIAWLMVRLNTF
jgi:hypothetical protein